MPWPVYNEGTPNSTSVHSRSLLSLQDLHPHPCTPYSIRGSTRVSLSCRRSRGQEPRVAVAKPTSVPHPEQGHRALLCGHLTSR